MNFVAAGLALALAGATGCGFEEDDCSLLAACGRCDPATSEGPIGDDCGYFVSASLGDDGFAGTKARPVRTLGRAVELAQANTSHVFACAEEFMEELVLPPGIKLVGGLDCGRAFVASVAPVAPVAPGAPGALRRTLITAPPDAVPVVVLGGERTTRLQGVTIRAADALVEGGSSIAVLALTGASLELLHSDVHAGAGAPGAQGESGSPLGGAASHGIAGEDGEVACEKEGYGGESPVLVCGDVATAGGWGGRGAFMMGAQGGAAGLPLSELPGFGDGGQGETELTPCTDGAAGLDGAHGEHGLGGSGEGRLSAFGFIGGRGANGRKGSPGQGGGGGGGTRSGKECPMGELSPFGAGGGAGGTGGCGGRGGKGGGFGGASIGVASVFAQVSLDAVEIFTGRGGDGSAGGAPELGGLGGPGGQGGVGLMNVSGGCAGGPGGRGGHGGHGGGGAGGPSIGVAFVGSAPELNRVIAVVGFGGFGGIAPMPESHGEDGVAADVLELEGAPSP